MGGRERVACFDIGTHTTNFLVAEARDGRVVPVAEALRFTRLGEGLVAGGPVSAAAMARLDAVLGELVEVADALGAGPRLAGLTSASRDASNQGELLALVARHGVTAQVVSGEEEATLTLEGVLSDGAAGRVTVIDIGGGSTELVSGRPGALSLRVSVDIGSVRLRDRHWPRLPPAPEDVARLRRDARAAIDGASVPVPLPSPVVGVAGTVACLVALSRGLDRLDPQRLEGAIIDAATVRRLARHLVTLSPAEVSALAPEVMAGRAELLPSGATLLDVLMEALGVPELRFSTRGLQHGLASRALNP
ncbi:MAG: exopolyphosphatase [Deltaproteobacteria bacterium]|nr:exopolyphosphatase [Deltaproteobacteria bacterium]